ncbi:hypothetical protein [Burkholderia cepacia]|uniref:hypothetical protein n=1 Tax=Burkholderia cepacia TaxID=292 RepID=UPI0007584F50|nr:hypothetical protein [Burkholderia cepacia]KWF90414.1 hypothetical protein WL95_27700 [Burkholderia cepacia]
MDEEQNGAKLRWQTGQMEVFEIQGWAEYKKYACMVSKQTIYRLDDLEYFVISVEMELGRGRVTLMPHIPLTATGEYLDRWFSIQTAAPANKPKPNHVRDAVEANR